MIKFLTPDTIKTLHTKLIERFGGIDGMRDNGLLESAIAYPQMLHEMAGEQNVCTLAAAYCTHLIKNHPARDGNKRMAILVMLTFLQLNNKKLKIPNNKLYDLAIMAATSQIDETTIAQKLNQYANNVE